MKRALCVSGGGATGAKGGGMIEGLIKKQNVEWDKFYGSSTGSLLITMLANWKIDALKKWYTGVTPADIFSINPFDPKGKVKIFNAVLRMFLGKTSLGDNGKLKENLRKMFTEYDYDKIKYNKRHICCVTTNYTTGCAEYRTSRNETYEDYLDYTIASCSVPIAMNPLIKNGSMYLDGGVMEHVPIQRAIDEGAQEIDVIIMRPEKRPQENWHGGNMMDVFLRTLELMQREISEDDVTIGKLMASRGQDVKLNLHYAPGESIANSLIFNKEIMAKWWRDGYDSIESEYTPKTLMITTNK